MNSLKILPNFILSNQLIMKTRQIDDQILRILLNSGYNVLLIVDEAADKITWKPSNTSLEECKKLNSMPSINTKCKSIKEALDFPEVLGIGGVAFIPEDIRPLLDEIL